MTQTPGVPGAQSASCLSCHDGTVAVGSIYNNGANAPIGAFTGTVSGTTFTAGGLMAAGNPASVGTNLGSDHPIAIVYPNLGNAGYRTATVVTGANAAGGLKLYGTTFQVECASCHAVHDNTTAPPFLRKLNSASALCTTCHIK